MPERGNRWEKARVELIARWRKVLERIEARDEGGTLELIDVMDEFCDQAIADRGRGGPPRVADPQAIAPGSTEFAGRCLFCRGFADAGGCFGIVELLNRAVLAGRWEAARTLAAEYLDRLRTVRFQPGASEAPGA
jgi:hypothetical protein